MATHNHTGSNYGPYDWRYCCRTWRSFGDPGPKLETWVGFWHARKFNLTFKNGKIIDGDPWSIRSFKYLCWVRDTPGLIWC